MEIEAEIKDTPCVIRVLSWEPYRPGFISGPPESCYPDEGGFGDWEILDQDRKPAEWLRDTLTDKDVAEIDLMLFKHIEGWKYGRF